MLPHGDDYLKNKKYLTSGDIAQMLMSVDDNNDGELNAPEFADFERIVRARAVETSQKALKVNFSKYHQ